MKRALAAALAALAFSVDLAPPARGGESVAPIATIEHVRLDAGGTRWSGWTLAAKAAGGYALLTDDGRVALLPRTSQLAPLESVEQPIAGLPTAALIAGLAHAERAVRDRCQELLAGQGAPALEALGAALSDASPEARRRALVLLAQLAPAWPKAAHTWLGRTSDRLRDGDDQVRRAALAAYVALGCDDARARCEEALQEDDSVRVRHEAIVQLGRGGDLRSVDRLLAHLATTDERSLRLVTFDALRRLTGKNFGRDEARWHNWWTNHRAELLPADAR